MAPLAREGADPNEPYPITLTLRLRVPHVVLAERIGRDDDTPEWLEAVERAVQRQPFMFLTYAIEDPTVEAG